MALGEENPQKKQGFSSSDASRLLAGVLPLHILRRRMYEVNSMLAFII
jgi:hypothetical protein